MKFKFSILMKKSNPEIIFWYNILFMIQMKLKW